MMIKFRSWVSAAACCLLLLPAKAQQTNVLRSKLFYLPVQLDARAALMKDPVLQQLGQVYYARVQQARRECRNTACYAAALRLKQEEVQQTGDRLVAHDMKKVVEAVRATGYYNKGTALTDTALLRFAWEQTAAGMNYIFDTYLAGRKPRYAIIDSISFNVNDPSFRSLTEKMLDRQLKKQQAKPYYALPVALATEVLLINGRDEAARYEPLTAGLNAKAYAAIAHTDWKKYPYTALRYPASGRTSPVCASTIALLQGVRWRQKGSTEKWRHSSLYPVGMYTRTGHHTVKP